MPTRRPTEWIINVWSISLWRGSFGLCHISSFVENYMVERQCAGVDIHAQRTHANIEPNRMWILIGTIPIYPFDADAEFPFVPSSPPMTRTTTKQVSYVILTIGPGIYQLLEFIDGTHCYLWPATSRQGLLMYKSCSAMCSSGIRIEWYQNVCLSLLTVFIVDSPLNNLRRFFTSFLRLANNGYDYQFLVVAHRPYIMTIK